MRNEAQFVRYCQAVLTQKTHSLPFFLLFLNTFVSVCSSFTCSMSYRCYSLRQFVVVVSAASAVVIAICYWLLFFMSIFQSLSLCFHSIPFHFEFELKRIAVHSAFIATKTIRKLYVIARIQLSSLDGCVYMCVSALARAVTNIFSSTPSRLTRLNTTSVHHPNVYMNFLKCFLTPHSMHIWKRVHSIQGCIAFEDG